MKDRSLSTKVFGVLALMAVAGFVIAGVGIYYLNAISTDLDTVVNGNYSRIEILTSVRDAQRQFVLRDSAILLSTDERKISKYTADREELAKKIEEAADQFLARAATEEGKTSLRKFKELFTEYRKYSEQFLSLKAHGKLKEAMDVYDGPASEVRSQMLSLLQERIGFNEKLMNEAVKSAREDYQAARLTLIIIALLSVLVSGGIASLVMVSMSRTINKIIDNLSDCSSQVASASEQVSQSAQSLSQASSEQAASLEQTAASLQEVTSMVRSNSENAEKTSEIASKSQQTATRGKEVVQHMIEAIGEIESSNIEIGTQMEESNRKIADIVKLISEIGQKTQVINDIVFQTKLLSFNASVEAARAGEHGKGFAVVAEEVGSLAQMSGNAAREITKMLDDSIRKVEGIVEDTKNRVDSLIGLSKEKVAVGTRIANECGSVLDEIVTSVASTTEMAHSIARASSEQAQGLSEITRAMDQLDQVTQLNASASEESASSSHQLSAQAENLSGIVFDLTHAIQGAATTGNSYRATERNQSEPPKSPLKSLKLVAKPTVDLSSKTSPLKVAPLRSAPAPARKASGADYSELPAANDDRFQDL